MHAPNPSRRRVLAARGIAALGSVAGCSTDEETTPTATATATPAPSAGSIPSYADFLPATGGDLLLFTAFDLDIEGGHQIAALPDDPTDPLRYNSVAGAYVEYLTGLLTLGLRYPFATSRLDTANRERVLNVNGVAVQQLPVDLSGALADAEREGGDIRFEAADRAVVAGPDGTPFGLTDDALVFPVLTEEAAADGLVRDVVDTRAGASDPAHDGDDGLASLLRRGDTSGSTAGGYAAGTDFATLPDERSLSLDLPSDSVGSATGALFSIDLDNGSPPQPASATIAYPEDATVDTEALSAIGSDAANRDLTRDAGRVRITGEYSWAALREFEGTGAAGS